MEIIEDKKIQKKSNKNEGNEYHPLKKASGRQWEMTKSKWSSASKVFKAGLARFDSIFN